MGTNDLLEELNEIYRLWKGDNKARTYAELARQSKVGYIEARRTLQGEIKPLFKIISPMLEVMAPESALGYYKKHFSEEYSLIVKIASCQTKAEDSVGQIKIYDTHYWQLMTDAAYFPILALLSCCGNDGMAKSTIKEQFGDQGIDKLNELIDLQIVEINVKDWVTLIDNHISTNVKTALLVLEQASHLMKSNAKAFAFNGFDAVNETTLKTIFTLYKETEEKILTILKDKNSKGDIPINWGGMLGRVGTSLLHSNSSVKSERSH